MSESGKGLDKKTTVASALVLDLARVSSPFSETDEDSFDSHHDAEGEAGGVGELQLSVRLCKNGRKRSAPFALTLMKILSCKGYAKIIAWTPSGLAFDIIKPRAFAKEVLPAHFKTAKYSSFIRKLHRWGFAKKIRDSREEKGTFFHKNFQKGRLDLVEKIRPAPRNLPWSKPHPTIDKAKQATSRPIDTMITPTSVYLGASNAPFPGDIDQPTWSARNQHQYLPPIQPFELGNSSTTNLRVAMELQRLLAEHGNGVAAPLIMPEPHQVDHNGQFGTAAFTFNNGIVSEAARRIMERFYEAIDENRALTTYQEYMFQQQGYNAQKNASTDVNAAIDAEVHRRLKTHLQETLSSHTRQPQANPFAFPGMNSIPLTPLQQCLLSGAHDSMLPAIPLQHQHLHLQAGWPSANAEFIGTMNNPSQLQESSLSDLVATPYDLLSRLFSRSR